MKDLTFYRNLLCSKYFSSIELLESCVMGTSDVRYIEALPNADQLDILLGKLGIIS